MCTRTPFLVGIVLAILGGGIGLSHETAAQPAVAAAATAPAPNYQGLWWHAPAGSESGWGINFAHQGDVIFATWFTYDIAGNEWWLSMTANRTAEGTYAGTVIQTAGPAFSANPFDPATVTRTAVGTGNLSFHEDGYNANFVYTVNGVRQTKAIMRQVYGPLPICTLRRAPGLRGGDELPRPVVGGEWGGIGLGHQPHAPERQHLRDLVHLRRLRRADVAVGDGDHDRTPVSIAGN